MTLVPVTTTVITTANITTTPTTAVTSIVTPGAWTAVPARPIVTPAVDTTVYGNGVVMLAVSSHANLPVVLSVRYAWSNYP